jgi:subfamily B ATP-binding cassette protein HlyB/CyaB
MADGCFVILAAGAPSKVLIRDFRRRVDAEEFSKLWSRRVILLTRCQRVSQLVLRFDLSWFIPELVRYRRMLGEILLARFFVLVVALITPIFFQLVIDKVLVHQGLSTIDERCKRLGQFAGLIAAAGGPAPFHGVLASSRS